MAITSIEFLGQDQVEAHVLALVALITTATDGIKAGKVEGLTSKCEPDTDQVQACAALLLNSIKAGVRAPIQVAVAQMIGALNLCLEGYGVPIIKVPA